MAENFIDALGYSEVRYVRAQGDAGPGSVYLTVHGYETELGRPLSNSHADIDVFVRKFQEQHSDAFGNLPRKVTIILELEPNPGAGHVLTLHL